MAPPAGRGGEGCQTPRDTSPAEEGGRGQSQLQSSHPERVAAWPGSQEELGLQCFHLLSQGKNSMMLGFLDLKSDLFLLFHERSEGLVGGCPQLQILFQADCAGAHLLTYLLILSHLPAFACAAPCVQTAISPNTGGSVTLPSHLVFVPL